MCVYLASDESSYFTGQVVTVDGRPELPRLHGGPVPRHGLPHLVAGRASGSRAAERIQHPTAPHHPAGPFFMRRRATFGRTRVLYCWAIWSAIECGLVSFHPRSPKEPEFSRHAAARQVKAHPLQHHQTFQQGGAERADSQGHRGGHRGGVVALPLSIALGIASGVSPEQGLYTAIVAGFLIAFLGGSRVQISGPTAAFATIVAGIVATDGIEGLIAATIIAGILLIFMGLFKLGALIRFVPFTITTGFTAASPSR